MMLLVKMKDCSSLLPLCMEDPFPLIDSYDNVLYGRKRKKKQSLVVAECRLDSPCNSPEVIMSGGIEDSTKSLFRSDSFTDALDSVEHGSMFGGVDMEGFCKISATVTAGEDIMLSSSAKENKLVLKEVAVKHDLSGGNVHSVSVTGSSVSNSSGLQSEFESDVDVLYNSLWQNKQMALASHDLLPDLSGLAFSGYLLSDIPSHPDLSGEASDSLLSYCSDKDECLSSSSSVPHTEHNNDKLVTSIKCEEDTDSQEQCEGVYSDFDSLCTNTLLDDMQTNLNDHSRTPSCQCAGHDCLCYKSDVSSTEEEDACIEYIVSHRPSTVRRATKGRAAHIRRGPGRPRKLQNTDLIRRGRGRPRKKSVSDAVVWYQTRRKRTVSLSNGSKSRNRQKSLSEDKDAQNSAKRVRVPSAAADKIVKPGRNRKQESDMQLSDCQPAFDAERLPSLQFVETGISCGIL